MAYLRDLPGPPKCYEQGCSSKATVQVIGNRNTEFGKFCKKHGNQHLKIQREYEQKGTSAG